MYHHITTAAREKRVIFKQIYIKKSNLSCDY
jgi:hypothetical protein